MARLISAFWGWAIFAHQYVRAGASMSIVAIMRRKILCGASSKGGAPCQCKAIRTMRGAWRCRLHGGPSTGPKTGEGRAPIAEAAPAGWSRDFSENGNADPRMSQPMAGQTYNVTVSLGPEAFRQPL
jgi:hypothetical protein